MISRETVIRIGRRYGCVVAEDGPDSQCEISFSADQLVALLEFVAVCEREACAKVCDEQWNDYCQESSGYLLASKECAAAIRARGQA